MHWRDLLNEVETAGSNAATNPHIGDVAYDSRRAGLGALFVAMRGESVDGNRFVQQALHSGAAAVLTDSRETFAVLDSTEFPVALVPHGRRALAQASAAVFDHPERKLAVSAVTGTNGKTTTAYLLDGLLAFAGRKTVLLGTIETRVCGTPIPSEHTTPEGRDILSVFREGTTLGATECVMEMSSHALAQERVYGIPVDTAIFTNLTQDHLDYHGSMEAYAAAKARLFTGVGAAPPRVAVLNAEDTWFGTMANAAEACGTRWTYGIEKATDFRASALALRSGSTSFQLSCPFGEARIESQLTGRVNVSNLLASMAAALSRGLTLEEVVTGAAALKPVPGRFETVPNSLGITAVVDYAHTDDALSNLITLARELNPHGRILTLFGCGGDRDRGKRPKMGRAAARGSDFVIVTSDNPRSEDPATIAEEAVIGIRETGFSFYDIVLDRATAVRVILQQARPGDTVLIAGKGHEKTQTARGVASPFDDVAVVAAVLREIEGNQKR